MADPRGFLNIEQQKKAAEDKAKFTGMKQHFDAGIALLGQANQGRDVFRCSRALVATGRDVLPARSVASAPNPKRRRPFP
jgi:hypothetical protein